MAQETLLNLVADHLGKGVILTLAEESDILSSIEFKTVNSNVYKYNVADVLPEAKFRALGEQPAEGNLSTDIETEALAILFNDISVDRAISAFQNVNDVMAENTLAGAKAMAKTLSKTFFYGNNTTNDKEFDGLEARLSKGKGTAITHSLTGAKADIEKLEELIDAVDGRPSVIYVNKATRRILNKIARENNCYSQVERFGKYVDSFDGIPVVVCEEVKDGHVFAVRYGTEYVNGLTINGIQTEDLGTVGVFRKAKIEGYVGLQTAHPKCFAMMKAE